jgi:hypothetical protein
MEEGGPDDATALRANVEVRMSSFEPSMSLQEGQRLLGSPMANRTKLTPVWWYMAKIARGLVDPSPDWRDRELALVYIRERLGAADGETFLAEILPLPKRSAASWPSIYAPWFATREEYEKTVRPTRIEMLRSAIREHAPRFIWAYGKQNSRVLLQILGNTAADTRRIAGTRVHVQYCNEGRTRAIASPFFGNGCLRYDEIEDVLGDLSAG